MRTAKYRGTGSLRAGHSAPGRQGSAFAAGALLLPAAAHRIGIATARTRVCALDADTPTRIDSGISEREAVPTPAGAVKLALGPRHGCFLTDAGAVFCWGDNDVGQLGTGQALDTEIDEPAPARGLEDIVEIAAAGDHTCALEEAGRAWYWGDNPGGVIRLDSQCAVPVPMRLSGP